MELYDIIFLDTSYYFTNYAEDLEINGIKYKAIPIKRQEIDMSIDFSGAKITAPIDVEPFKFLVLNPTMNLPTIKITKYPDNLKLFDGNIVTAEFNYDSREVTISLGSKYIINEAKIPKRSYSNVCNFNFCDENCGLNINNYKIQINNFSINGTDIISSEIINIPFNITGGFVTTQKGEKQYIISSDKFVGKITLLKPFIFTNDIDYITIYGSCDKSVDNCKLYGNESRYGGFPYIPDKNIATEGF